MALVFVLHALFALALWYVMQPKTSHPAVVHRDSDQTLIVRLIVQPSVPRVAPPPAPPTPHSLVQPRQAVTPRSRPVTHEKSHRDAMVVQDHEATPAQAASVVTPAAINLYAKDGSVRLPPTTAGVSATASAEVKPAKPADDRQIMHHDSNQMHYKVTRFEKYFPPPNETAGGAVGRHIGDAIKEMAKSICNPKGGAVSNALCGAPPLPPSPKDGDERLNLPPPPLADDPQPTKPLPLSTCIAEYKADKPLSYGCPINTPDLAFKAEMRVCIDLFRAGKRLKTWCPLDTSKRAAAESSMPAASSSVGSH